MLKEERKEREDSCHSKTLSYETLSHIQKEGETDLAQTGAAMEKQTQTADPGKCRTHCNDD